MTKPRWPLITSAHRYGLTENDVTHESLYQSRRQFIRNSGLSGLALAGYLPHVAQAKVSDLQQKLKLAKRTRAHTESLTPLGDVTQYNNFYELGTAKTDPYENASALQTEPWSITVEGECAKPGQYALETLLAPHALEERIYKLRCVEAWSMIIPWTGFTLADLLKRFEPTSDAKYVAFETVYHKDRPLPGQKRRTIEWPYREGLRMDEAMHPLTFMAVGLYGKPLPNQNGAPIRLVVPWKYGFKSIKSITAIRFTKTEPKTSWNMIAPKEYGFYSNVNPTVNHPRWSQKRERRIGEYFKVDTEIFNGYAEEVAGLYKDMNLKTYF
ncbi:protein-methionine-sulfoxide reductase catalytic subunit MsrP [Teredinibacter purpureus]|uniref:protein-methionine-sulfoxide reductase catalytic subunit MsrP n=1 Tax=Teredinibacter purpureus TaxID=2731756 RepID=UPI0005F82CFD|nr:protein-methionine-sulfoxide reductase catalytic subunit MsrP [Teredinibacter purpureus]